MFFPKLFTYLLLLFCPDRTTLSHIVPELTSARPPSDLCDLVQFFARLHHSSRSDDDDDDEEDHDEDDDVAQDEDDPTTKPSAKPSVRKQRTRRTPPKPTDALGHLKE